MADEPKEAPAAPDEPVEAFEEVPAWKGSLSSKEPIIMPDGHVVLSKEDIKAAKDK